jgi:hypothetical protein
MTEDYILDWSDSDNETPSADGDDGGGIDGHHNRVASPSAILASSSPTTRSVDDDDLDTSSLGPYDVVCGRHRAAFRNVGNRRFRFSVSLVLPRYLRAPTRKAKSLVIARLAELVQSNGGRFLEQQQVATTAHNGSATATATTWQWVELSKKKSHQKVGHALRDMALVGTERHRDATAQRRKQPRQEKQRQRKDSATTATASASSKSSRRRNSDGSSNSNDSTAAAAIAPSAALQPHYEYPQEAPSLISSSSSTSRGSCSRSSSIASSTAGVAVDDANTEIDLALMVSSSSLDDHGVGEDNHNLIQPPALCFTENELLLEDFPSLWNVADTV